jgi:hypothetical protein
VVNEFTRRSVYDFPVHRYIFPAGQPDGIIFLLFVLRKMPFAAVQSFIVFGVNDGIAVFCLIFIAVQFDSSKFHSVVFFSIAQQKPQADAYNERRDIIGNRNVKMEYRHRENRLQIADCGRQTEDLELSTKLEYRNTKQIQNSNFQKAHNSFEHLSLENLILSPPKVSPRENFELMISEFRSWTLSYIHFSFKYTGILPYF